MIGALLLLEVSSAGAHPTVDERLKALSQAGGGACRADLALGRGRVLRAEGRLDEALSEYEAAAACDPGAEGLHLARAQVYLDAKLPRAAIAAVDRWLVVHAQRGEGLLVRAQARVAIGKFTEAAADYAEAVGALRAPQPDHVLAWSRAAEQGGELDDAVAALDEGMKRLGVVPALAREAVLIDAGRGRTDAALSRIERAMAVLPPRFDWLRLRGEVLERAGRRDEAGRALDEGLAEIARSPRRTAAIAEAEREMRAARARVRGGGSRAGSRAPRRP